MEEGYHSFSTSKAPTKNENNFINCYPTKTIRRRCTKPQQQPEVFELPPLHTLQPTEDVAITLKYPFSEEQKPEEESGEELESMSSAPQDDFSHFSHQSETQSWKKRNHIWKNNLSNSQD